MKKYQILKWVIFSIAVAINLFILVNAFMNGEVSAKESNSIAHTAADAINIIIPDAIPPSNFPQFAFNFRKAVGHFGLFALSGGFTSWALYLFVKKTKVGYFLYQLAVTLGFGLLLAVITELVQILVDGRYGTFADVGIDFGGYFSGVFLVFLIFFLKKSPIFKKEKKWRKSGRKIDLIFLKEKTHFYVVPFSKFSGGGKGIRTPAKLAPTTGFRNRPLQPLGYSSAENYNTNELDYLQKNINQSV